MVPRKSKGIIMYLAMFGLLIVLLFAMMSMDQPVSNLKYYQVLDYFRNGEVEEYQIDYNDGTLTLKLEGQDQLVDYQLASITQFNQDIQPYIDQYEQTNDTTFKRNYLPAQETSLLVSLLPTLLLLGGMIIALIGVVGEYIGRIYLSINRSPQFVVRSVTRGAAEGIHQPEEREMNADEDHACGLGA